MTNESPHAGDEAAAGRPDAAESLGERFGHYRDAGWDRVRDYVRRARALFERENLRHQGRSIRNLTTRENRARAGQGLRDFFTGRMAEELTRCVSRACARVFRRLS